MSLSALVTLAVGLLSGSYTLYDIVVSVNDIFTVNTRFPRLFIMFEGLLCAVSTVTDLRLIAHNYGPSAMISVLIELLKREHRVEGR